MNLLCQVEEYILETIISNNHDEIILDRLNCFDTINNHESEIKSQESLIIAKLIKSLKKDYINKKPKFENKFRKLFENCYNLLERNNHEKLDEIFFIIDKIKFPFIYKYFFNKIKIKQKINFFNNYFPLCQEELLFTPNRKFITNEFDLKEDIKNIIKYLELICFDYNHFSLKNINNNVIKYKYFFELLKYNLEIIDYIKNNNLHIYNQTYEILKKIEYSKKYKIPIKLKSGFIF